MAMAKLLDSTQGMKIGTVHCKHRTPFHPGQKSEAGWPVANEPAGRHNGKGSSNP
jgi:hypothetical protein